jgi:L-lactate permease
MDGKVKIYYKVWTNIQSNVQFSITTSFTKIIQMLLRSMQAGLKTASAAFGMCSGLSIFGTIILHTTKLYKVKSNYKRR